MLRGEGAFVIGGIGAGPITGQTEPDAVMGVARLRDGRDAGRGGRVKRFLTILTLAAVAAGLAAWVVTEQPAWYVRIRYPLRYQAIVTAATRATTGSTRRCSRP